MPDIFENLYDELSKRLPNKGDRELLKELLDIQKKGGKEMLQGRIKSMMEELEGADI